MPVAVRPHEVKHSGAAAVQPHGRRVPRRQFTVVETLTRPEPSWLPLAIAMQKVTRPVAVLSLASVLILYGTSTMMERDWGTRFRDLERLKSKQNSLVTLTERQKYQIPRSLEVAPKGHVELKQDRVLFVRPESLRSVQPKSRRQSTLSEDRPPIGY
ncbi:MAG: hypothetical protein AAGB01_10135 [Cyanobacteria bacterium P01_F01_bin.42]